MKLTKTETAIMNLMRDGERHHKTEILELLDHPIIENSNSTIVCVHMHNIRKKLTPLGYNILCEYYRRNFYYRLVRIVTAN